VKQDKRLSIYPLDSDVIKKSVNLTSINEMHDRQIVSTALVVEEQGNQVALLSCDLDICTANLVRIVLSFG
jgi:hypothetical protein